MINRRNFLIGSAGGLTIAALTACTPPTPVPTPSILPTGTATPPLVPTPINALRTNWSADPFAGGSFSFPAVGSTPEQRAALAEPVMDRVFLAGEATSVTAPATVQGAREAGLAAATLVTAAAAAGERVAVIGAGMAGVTAARQLTDAGYSVILIEARGRIGGRIDTVSGSDWPFPIERGASFVRPPNAQGLDEDLSTAGVATAPFTGPAETRTPDGAVVDVPPVGAEQITRALDWAAAEPRDVSVADALVGVNAPVPSTTATAGTPSDAEWLGQAVTVDIDMVTGASADTVSAWYAPTPSGEAAADVETRIVLGGFDTLLTDESAGLDVLLSTIITRVSYTADSVSLRTATGESVPVDRVILTVPLGVLKAEAIEFDPVLPFAHRGAIAALGMGVLDKVWLRFDKPFWTTEAEEWHTVGAGGDFPVWANLMPLTGQPVLMGTVAAGSALRLADLSDEEVIKAALVSLEPFAVPPAE